MSSETLNETSDEAFSEATNEVLDKVKALAGRIDALLERAESSIVNAPDGVAPEAEAKRLLAVTILKNSNLSELIVLVCKAAPWQPSTPESEAKEAEAENSLEAHLHRYRAAICGEPQPVFSRQGVLDVWTAHTGTSPESADFYFRSIIDVLLPHIESIADKAEQLLNLADTTILS